MEKQLLPVINFVIKAHHGQERNPKNSGEPYVSHVVRVAQMVAENGGSTSAVITALLHDVVEDTSYELIDLKFLLEELLPKPIIDYIIQCVDRLTIRNDETKIEAMLRLTNNYEHENYPLEALFVKMCDMVDNYKKASPKVKQNSLDRAKVLYYTYSSLFAQSGDSPPFHKVYLELKGIFDL